MSDDKTTTVLVRQQRVIADYLRAPNRVEMVRAILPDDMDAERMVAIAVSAVLDNEKLAECEPKSILAAVMQAGRLGLEVGGLAGEAYLIPYKIKGVLTCTFQAGYKGWLRIIRSAKVEHVRAAVAYEKDHFRFSEEPLSVEHEPLIASKGKRGALICAYATARTPKGELFDATYVTPDELEQVREDTPAWRDWTDRMRRKTAIKRLASQLPLRHQSARAVNQLNAIEHSEDVDAGPARYYDEDINAAIAADNDPVPTPASPTPGKGRVSGGQRGRRDTSRSEGQKPSSAPKRKDPPAKTKPAPQGPPPDADELSPEEVEARHRAQQEFAGVGPAPWGEGDGATQDGDREPGSDDS